MAHYLEEGIVRAMIPLVMICIASGSSHAAELNIGKTDDGTKTIIKLSGQITAGDADKLSVLLGKSAIAGEQVAGLWLDSPGGSIVEGLKIAEFVHTIGMTTVVAHDAMCASVCFLTVAAGSSKFASRRAHVGVHSAVDQNGQEDIGAMAATVVMAGTATLYGVPAAITGAMVNTLPSQITWLTADELGSMGVVLSGTSEQQSQLTAIPLPAVSPNIQPPAMQLLGADPPPNDYATLTGALVQSECHIGSCFWFSIESNDTIFDTNIERVTYVIAKLWTADYPDGDYTKKVTRRFDRDTQSYVICSRSRPQIIDGNDKDGWMRTGLAPGDRNSISGNLEPSLSFYWAACHGRKVEDVFAATSIAQGLGYPAKALEGMLGQSQIDEIPILWFSTASKAATTP